MDRIDVFIADLYRGIQSGHIEDFRHHALQQLQRLLAFDGAVWGSGGYGSQRFHSIAIHGLPKAFVGALENTRASNPLLIGLIGAPGRAVDVRALMSDDRLEQCDAYRQCYARHGIAQAMGYLNCGPQNGVHSIISLYRFTRERPFQESERLLFERAAFHLATAASHALFTHVRGLARSDSAQRAAVCDRHGLLYQSEPGFHALIENAFGPTCIDRLPFSLPPCGERRQIHDLCVDTHALGDLISVRVRPLRAVDSLAGRDRAIVDAVCRGMTFKDIGRELQMAPSTISNRLYRVYRELGVTSRSSLVRLVHEQ